ncbi:MAG: 1-phosphofructokinase family hexose kinase [Paeniglutamicibacter terrestris]
MIVTLTMNPSMDRTIELSHPLQRGGVQRAQSLTSQAAGKGVNVARALASAGVPTLAVLPGDPHDPVIVGLIDCELPHVALPIGQALRTNLTLAEADGTTTKINAPGPLLDNTHQRALIHQVLLAADGANWLIMAGSLPPGVPDSFYATLVAEVRRTLGSRAPRIAVDTSGAPLIALFAAGPECAPDLIKPNAEELAELTGQGTEETLEADPQLVVEAAGRLISHGTAAVLATLGSKGAVLVTASGSWHARHPPVTARSTVGAGDSALAGYLLADAQGLAPAECLRQAVAHGSAAVSLPGSTIPAPEHTNPRAVTVAALSAPLTTEGKP